MSMVSEQVKQLKEEANYLEKDQEKRLASILYQAADTIESLSAKLQAANMGRPEADCGGGWIPCSGRLPEKDGKYICTQETHSLSDGKIVGKSVESVEFYNGDWRRAGHLKVIAWQPLPEAYHGP